jgi:hypothetical protein
MNERISPRMEGATPANGAAQTGLLRRKCACDDCRGQHGSDLQRASVNSAPEGSSPPAVNEARHLPVSRRDSFTESRFEHDFSHVRTRSDARVADTSPVLSLSINGAPMTTSRQGAGEVFLDGSDTAQGGGGNSPAPAQRPQAPPNRTAANCPTDISVARVEQGNDVDFGKDGPITGWGGFALMEVSDPAGRTWDGTAIHENLRNIRNTCGAEGNNACSNRSGQGGAAGSTFEVGKASSFLGLAALPAATNRFYDLHIFARKGFSLLHSINRPNCEVQCQQSFDCGGRRLGPDFLVTYAMTRDSVSRPGGGFNALTRVAISAAPRAAPAPPPTGGARP